MEISDIPYVPPANMSDDPQCCIPDSAGLSDSEKITFLMFAGKADSFCYRIEEVMRVIKATREEVLFILKRALRKLKTSNYPLRAESHERRRMRIAEDLQHAF